MSVFLAALVLAQSAVVSPTPVPVAPVPAATAPVAAQADIAPPTPRPTLGPDRPGARFGSDPSIDLTDPRHAALELGHRELDAWQTEKALKIYKKFVKKNDAFPDGHFWVGVAADLSGDLPLACSEFRRYLALAPSGFYVGAVKTRAAACPVPTPSPHP